MNRTTAIFSTADLSVHRFDHPPHEVHCDPEREVADHWSIAFVETGGFRLRDNHQAVDLNTGGVLLTYPGLEFSCHHGAECPDDVCLSVRFHPHAVTGAEHAWARAGWVARPRATPRLAMVYRRLAGAARQGNAFETERWALAALGGLRTAASHHGARGSYAPRSRDVEAVITVCREIESYPTRQQSVAERARSVAMTSTQLSHAFIRYLGVSPHQYVVRWRLVSATEMLEDRVSVSESCYRAGFDNLSHFCRTFQRRLGCRASQWRHMDAVEKRRKVQAMLGTAS